MMDMKFSPDWLRRVAKEEEDVRFSVGGWTSGIIRPGRRRLPLPLPSGGDVGSQEKGY
jgi:hypothetical protein